MTKTEIKQYDFTAIWCSENCFFDTGLAGWWAGIKYGKLLTANLRCSSEAVKMSLARGACWCFRGARYNNVPAVLQRSTIQRLQAPMFPWSGVSCFYSTGAFCFEGPVLLGVYVLLALCFKGPIFLEVCVPLALRFKCPIFTSVHLPMPYVSKVLHLQTMSRPIPPPPPPRGILPHGNFWLPWPSKYTVQVVCKWAVTVCVCGAGSNKCTVWHSKLRWPCLLATHLLWQKRPFPYIVLLFEQFNML